MSICRGGFLRKLFADSTMPPAMTDSIAPPGYSAIHHMRDGRGGGVSIIHRSCLRVSVANLSTPTASFEKIGIKIASASSVLTVVGIYRPPPAPTAAFFDDFRAFRSEIQAQPGMQFICGDFNCPGSFCDTIDERLSD